MGRVPAYLAGQRGDLVQAFEQFAVSMQKPQRAFGLIEPSMSDPRQADHSSSGTGHRTINTVCRMIGLY